MSFPCKKMLMAVAILGGVACNAQAAKPQAERVELFRAVEEEQIGVRLIPKDATQATVIIENKTKRPLSIQLPKAFVGMPVLAQNNNLGGGGNSSSSSNQSMGGGMGGMGGGMMGGMGGGFFNVGPEKVGKMKVVTVCLEHGKEDPNPRVPYEMKPATEFTQDENVIAILTMLGDRKLDQVSAQAAAWHLADGLSWRQLAEKIKMKHFNGSVEMYFNTPQLRLAMQAVQVARVHTASLQQETAAAAIANSPGELLE